MTLLDGVCLGRDGSIETGPEWSIFYTPKLIVFRTASSDILFDFDSRLHFCESSILSESNPALNNLIYNGIGCNMCTY